MSTCSVNPATPNSATELGAIRLQSTPQQVRVAEEIAIRAVY